MTSPIGWLKPLLNKPMLFFSKTSRKEGLCPFQKGLTLVEVVLSIVILSAGIISVQKVFISSLSVLGIVENWDQAEGLIQKKIWEVERDVKEKGRSLEMLNESGILLGANRSYRYELTGRSLSPDRRLGAVRIKVFWEAKKMSRSIVRDFYLWVPHADKTQSSL